MAIRPGIVRIGPNGHRAIKMGPGVTAGPWYVMHPDHGGAYSSEDTVADWPEYTSDAAWREGKEDDPT